MRKRPIQLTGEPPRDVDRLRDRIEEQHAGETDELCRMLAPIQSPLAGDALRRLAVHESQIVRAAAVAALGARLDEPETMTTIRHGLGDPRPTVVMAAIRATAARTKDFRNELRALAAMPNEDASPTWAAVANDALCALAAVCETVDLDLAVRAFADAGLERGGAFLLDALLRRLPIAALTPVLAAHAELREHALASLASADGNDRLRELAASQDQTIAAPASRALAAFERRTTLRYVPPDQRLDVAQIIPYTHDGDATHSYHFADDPDLDARLGAILNEACHVFRRHADGHWASEYKDRYATALCGEIRANPWLIKRLFALRDRVVTSLVYRAMQLRDAR